MVGQCPHCGGDPIVLNVRKDHWAMCEDDKVRWHVGTNLFSSWLEEDESTWEENTELLTRCEEVEPVHLPKDYSDERIDEITSSWADEEE